MSIQNMSLFIPAVFKNITEKRIISAFEKVKLGKVSQVIFIDKNEKFKSVHIHFINWNNTESSRIFQQKAKTSEGAKLVYDDPWHWIVLEYKQKTHETKMPPLPYEKYVEVPLSYVTNIERENDALLRENDNLKNQLYHSNKNYKKATNKIQLLNEQIILMETKMRENDHHSKIYIDEIISLKNKIITIEEVHEEGEEY
jgi:hypothetical protein